MNQEVKSGKERLLLILENEGKTAEQNHQDANCRKTVAQFAREIGLETDSPLRDLLRGKTKDITAKLARTINYMKPKYNLEWLLSGKGEMLDKGAPGDRIPEKKKAPIEETLANLVEMLKSKDNDIRQLRQELKDALQREKDLTAVIDKLQGLNAKGAQRNA